MHTYKLVFLLVLLPVLCFTQQTINGVLVHNGIDRSYILYVPANYDSTIQMPVVINYHGFGSNASEQMWYGDFRSIADTAGFLIVHPQGTLFNGQAHWNVGGFTLGSTADDVGFTEALIEALEAKYSIDENRVYATGMSNGGFMSFLLACQLSDRIAAIAAVAGSMTPEITSNCSPLRPVPILQIHGTNDGVVPYTGALWTNPIPSVITYWTNHNDCNPVPVVTTFPDIVPADGSTVERNVYHDGEKGIINMHYKVINGAHTWPGSLFALAGTNKDINASKEIWQFFSQFDLNGLILSSATGQLKTSPMKRLDVFPNPTKSIIHLSVPNQQQPLPYEIFDLTGQLVSQGDLQPGIQQISLTHLPPQVYWLKVNEATTFIIRED